MIEVKTKKKKKKKKEILANLCYTERVYERINKKLDTTLSKGEIETLISTILKETDHSNFSKTGKNFYITNQKRNIRLTINANTFRIITVDLLSKLFSK